jgi:hypothetical protein
MTDQHARIKRSRSWFAKIPGKYRIKLLKVLNFAGTASDGFERNPPKYGRKSIDMIRKLSFAARNFLHEYQCIHMPSCDVVTTPGRSWSSFLPRADLQESQSHLSSIPGTLKPSSTIRPGSSGGVKCV